jgi:protein-disulfide isomerase
MAELHIPVSSNDHILGAESAPVVLVEYGDYECPHCGHAHPVVKRLVKHFGEKLALVYRNFPLSEIHPNAEIAAESAEFSGAGGQFWKMHDAIFENQRSLGLPMLMALADDLELGSANLEKALLSHEFAARVKSDFMGGVRSGVNGTPTFFINGQRFDGPAMYEEMVAAIDGAMK